MSKLIEAFPSLVRELSQSLRTVGQALLSEQVEGAVIDRVTFDETANAGYIYVKPSQELNVVDSNIMGIRHGSTTEAETRYWTYIDMDNFDRLVGIEILAPGDLKSELKKLANG